MIKLTFFYYTSNSPTKKKEIEDILPDTLSKLVTLDDE